MNIDLGEISCSSRIARCPRSVERPVIATVAPRSHNLRAIASPIPADPPEMNTTTSVKGSLAMCLPYQPHRKVASTSTLFLVGLVIIVHKFEQHSHFGFYEFIAHLLPRLDMGTGRSHEVPDLL